MVKTNKNSITGDLLFLIKSFFKYIFIAVYIVVWAILMGLKYVLIGLKYAGKAILKVLSPVLKFIYRYFLYYIGFGFKVFFKGIIFLLGKGFYYVGVGCGKVYYKISPVLSKIWLVLRWVLIVAFAPLALVLLLLYSIVILLPVTVVKAIKEKIFAKSQYIEVNGRSLKTKGLNLKKEKSSGRFKMWLKGVIYQVETSVGEFFRNEVFIFNKKKTDSIQHVKKSKSIFIFSLLIIPIVHFFIFWVGVNIGSIMMAFQVEDIAGNTIWTLEHFVNMFADFARPDSTIGSYLIVTLKYFPISNFVILPLSLLLSYFLFKKVLGYKAYRVIFFLPSIISAVVLTTIFKNFIGPTGPIGALQESLGLIPINFLKNQDYALGTIFVYIIWTGFGMNIVLFSGAMGRIPQDVLEYAQIDGVGMAREFVSLVVPMIWPTLSTLFVFGVVGLFTANGPVLLLTQGNYGTTTIAYYVFDQVKNYNSYNYPSAIGLFFTLVGLPIVLIVKALLEKVDAKAEY